MDGFKDKFVGFAATSLREIVSYIAFSFTVRPKHVWARLNWRLPPAASYTYRADLLF